MSKRLVICCDGTWNKPDQKDKTTNVVYTARAVLPVDPEGVPQVVFYDRGVGTGNVLDRFSGGAFGKGISTNIQDAYRFIVHNYEAGDELYFFGFSRGAYTVRSTAGLIRNAGVLKKANADRIADAYALYRGESKPSDRASIEFREQFSHEPRVHFIGVWDTVGSLGVPVSGLRFLTKGKYQFHDVQLSSHVDHAYHALAIDERRGPFAPTLWTCPKDAPNQSVEQVWFAGVHSNIGGGYPDRGLSDQALVWMIEKAQGAGLAFDPEIVGGFAPDPRGVLENSKTGFYFLTRAHHRYIGAVSRSTAESVHPSALERRSADPYYHPENLENHLKREAGSG